MMQRLMPAGVGGFQQRQGWWIWMLPWLIIGLSGASTTTEGTEHAETSLRPIESIHDFVTACDNLRQGINGSALKDLGKLHDGLQQFSRGNYSAAAKMLADSSFGAGIAIGDYALYYRGLALRSMQDRAGAERLWQQLISGYPQSPLAVKAAVQLAEAALIKGDYPAAGRLLQEFRNSRDPQLLVALAKASAGLKDYAAASQLLEAVYFDSPFSDESRQAAALLQNLKQTGKLRTAWNYPRYAARIQALLADSRNAAALTESQRLPLPQQEPDRSLVLLIKGKCSYLNNRPSGAISLLKMVGTASPQVHAEALLYLALSYRRLNQFDRFALNCQTLRNTYPDSRATEEALFNLANHYSLKERSSEAFQIYRWLAQQFPGGEFAAQGHWKLIWSDYLAGDYGRTIDGIVDHLKHFRESPYRRAAFYWMGRALEQTQDREGARTVYQALVGKQSNDYYSLLADKALASLTAGNADAGPAPITVSPGGWHQVVSLARPKPPAFPPGYLFEQQATQRILELTAADLPQQALSELSLLEAGRTGDLGAQLLKAQIYARQGDRWGSVRTLSRAIPQYSSMETDQLPRQIWEILYPLEYWKAIKASSQKAQLDPLLVAAVIRQESLFNASARSKAQAMGLMQIIPPTGVELARRLQSGFSASKLYNGEFNVRLGTLHLSDLLNRYKGKLYQALAAYNAGQGRVDRWAEVLPKESEEFVESIPFTETRDYVKRIMTHWTHYRQLYSE